MAKQALLVIAAVVLAITPVNAAHSRTNTTKHFAAKADKAKPDVTYGRVREFTSGQKIVIDVDNAPDKTFDLNDKDVAVHVAAGLKVGDPVKVTEHSVAGKTKRVEITHHAGGGVSHGDKKTAAEEKK